jgi:Zn-dependent protease
MSERLQTFIILVPIFVASLTLHELAHGWVAFKLGDPTAKMLGRLSLNPLVHLDPLGTAMFGITYWAGGFLFGWAKPVPVNYRRLRNPRRDMVLVALAGPGMNLLLALIGTALLSATIIMSGGAQDGGSALIAANALNFVLINIFLAVFNLLPVPPFDGGHVVEGLLPGPLALSFRRIGRYSLLVLMILLLVLPALGVNVVGHVVSPIVDRIAGAMLALFGIRA